jgi:hypothetical protein
MEKIFLWEQYCFEELARVRPVLTRVGFELDDVQPQLGGERSVISGNKLVLFGRRISDGKRVVIKASSRPNGRAEIQRERSCRDLLERIRFAYNAFLSPEQIAWYDDAGCLLSITEYIEQDCPFLDRSLPDQFFLAMKAFEVQEGAHAATYEHQRAIRGVFGVATASAYLTSFATYITDICSRFHERADLPSQLQAAMAVLHQSSVRIDQYGGFLTHTDFVPHNFRVVGRDIYLLDHSSMRFGNKYEGWARFLNFMLLYHPALERALVTYVKDNRVPEESEALHAMRVFRLGEIIRYYTLRLEKTSGNLRALDRARIDFWSDALASLLNEKSLPESRIQTYRDVRDGLRSDEEKQRQRGLH